MATPDSPKCQVQLNGYRERMAVKQKAGNPAPSKFDLRREATRAELIKLGVNRIPELGYASATIEDIVRDSGRTRGAFYFHFESKEDFFEAILLERASHRGNWWLLADRPDLASIEEALRLVFAKFEEVDAGGERWALLTAEYAKSVQTDAERISRLRNIYDGWLGEIQQFIEILRKRGLARSDLDARTLAAEMFAIAEGHYLHHEVYGAEPASLIDALTRVLRV